jgi:hypothetical protein
VCLIKAPFLLDENLVAGGFSYANFAGNANLPIGLNDQQVGIDPASLQQLITLVPPAGGWRWETTGLGNLPQTIYGFVVVTNPSVGPSVLIGMQTFLNPVHLSEAGQEIVIDAIEMPIALQPLGD